jgi:hypothetical protein
VKINNGANLHTALKRTIKYMVLILDALGDSEMRFLSVGASWDRAVGDASTAYGYTEQANVRLRPTPREHSQADIVARWLAWLGKHEGPKAVPRIVSWAHDEPMWRMAMREKCSERTIANRIDRSVAAIMAEFGGGEVDVGVIEEGPDKPIVHFATRGVEVQTGVRQGSYGRVWIDGVGFMKDGRRMSRGDERLDLRRLERARA